MPNKGQGMKRLVAAGLAALAVLAVTPAVGEAWYRWSSGVYIGAGPWYWPGPFYGYGYGYGYPYWGPYGYGPYAYPSTIVVEPPEYIEQSLPAMPSPPPAPPAPPAYWYYCWSAGGYYPNVANCPEEWVKVQPRDR